jgi:hypothetical protein
MEIPRQMHRTIRDLLRPPTGRGLRHPVWPLVILLLALVSLGTPTAPARSQTLALTPASEPILVVLNSSASSPFGPYLTEILRAEGITAFQTEQLTNLTSTYLASFPTVILTSTTLSAAQATLFTAYVSGGGTLIALRPDPQLAPVFGLTPATGTTADGYILVNAASPVGSGIASQTLQFHGTADHYTLNGATVVATIYSDAATATPFPAVVLSTYGAGRAAAFTYDLAQSIAYTRQGNPATAGTDVDGDGVIRTIEGFIGWDNLDRLAIPQADEQQRLLSNLIVYLGKQTTPIPRLWYFPTAAERSLIVLTGDDHGQPTSTFQTMANDVAQRGGRMTFYLSRYGFLTAAAEQSLWNQGFEFGLHPYGYQDGQTLAQGYASALSWFLGQGYLGPSNTVRTHMIEWQGWVDAARIEQQYGMQLDTNFYLWGPWLQRSNGQWVCAGYPNGSGLPLPFVDQTGTIIPLYQQATELVDEQMIAGIASSYCNLSQDQALALSEQFLDQSQAGFYSAITVQAHTDYYLGNTSQWLQGLLSYAQTKGIPVWTASRWASFVQARHDAAISNLAWNPTSHQLSFQVGSSVGEPTLTILVPADVQGFPVTAATVDGVPVATTSMTVKGLSYIGLPVSTGTHAVTVSYSTTATVTSTPTSTPTATATATATATPTVTPTATVNPSQILFSDGFEGGSFAADGWTLDVSGTGSTAQIVTAPVWSGSKAAQFTTQTQQNGERAFAEASLTWPSSQIVEATAMIQPNVSAIQYFSRVFSLDTQGPHSWGPRAAFALGPGTFGAIYTTRDGSVNYVDTGVPYQSGQWYQLALLVDYRETNPVFTFRINGATALSVTDTTTGSDTDRPALIVVGFGPGAWGTNSGAIVADAVIAWNAANLPTPTPTATATATPTWTATPTRTRTPTATATPCTTGCTPTPTSTTPPTPGSALTSTPTPTATPCTTCTATATPTATSTPTPCTTCTATPTPTPTATRTPTATPIPPPITTSLIDTTVGDFAACGIPAGLAVTDFAGGELRLAATLEDAFDTSLSPSTWLWGTWNGSSYTPAPSAGILPVQSASGSAWVRSAASFTQQILEAYVSFGTGPWEHVGFGDDGFTSRYAILSTFNDGTTLYARTYLNGTEIRTPLSGISLNAYHTIQIAWGASSVDYYVDGALVASHPVSITAPMYIYLSNNSATATLYADWVRIDQYPTTAATYTSCIKDAGQQVSWATISWQGQSPAGTSVSFQTRTSPDAVSWSAWSSPSGGQITSPPGRYLQYAATLTGTSQLSPEIDQVVLTTASPTATPTATGTATLTPSPTPSPSPTLTATPTGTPSPTPAPSATATPTPSATPPPTSTPTSSATPSPSSTPTPGPSASATPTAPTTTSTPTASGTATPTASLTPSATASATPTP